MSLVSLPCLQPQTNLSFHKDKKTTCENLPTTFPAHLLDPNARETEDFLSWVDDFAINHMAVNHHLLNSFARGAYGTHHVRVLLRFLKCYQLFSKKFAFYVNECRNLTSNSEARHLLAENLDEENGVYDEQFFEQVFEDFGIERKSIELVRHGELFNRVIQSLETYFAKEDPIGYEAENILNSQNPNLLKDIAEPLLNLTKMFEDSIDKDDDAPDDDNENEKKFIQCLSTLYWGSELIVSRMYPMI